jgi:hypothetical protein
MKLFRKQVEEEKVDFSELRDRFEEIKAIPIKKSTDFRIINLRMIVGCGCGGGSTKIHAIVPKGRNFNYSEGDNIDDDDALRLHSEGIQFKKGFYYGDVDDYDPDRRADLF